MVKQMVQTTDRAKSNQRRLFERDTRYASAQPQQDNADIFRGVVSQQALDVVFHQRIQTTDERGDHAEHQQRDPHHSGALPPSSDRVKMPSRPIFMTTVENNAAAGAEALVQFAAPSRAAE